MTGSVCEVGAHILRLVTSAEYICVYEFRGLAWYSCYLGGVHRLPRGKSLWCWCYACLHVFLMVIEFFEEREHTFL